MLNKAALVTVMKFAMMMLMILQTGVEAAPTERGFMKPPDPLLSLTHLSTVPEKSAALNPSKYLKQWLLSTKSAGVDGTSKTTDKTTTRTITAGIRMGQLRIHPGTVDPDKEVQMVKMISALEELHRTFNNTLNTRITIMPRANSRNSGRRKKLLLAGEGGVKPTTATPAAADSTASRTSTDVIVPSLTDRNFRKSLSPQPKKTNKRVCFWKYCSQN